MKRIPKKNIDIRTEIMRAGLRNHEVGMKLGLTETRFSKLLNSDLSEDDRGRVMTAIQDLSGNIGDE